MVRSRGGGDSGSSYHALLHTYVDQTTTHGIKKIGSSRHRGRKAFWACVFLASFSACVYHCSYLVMTFLSNPKVTITQEKDADVVDFPSLTVCNLNIIKKGYAHSYFKMASVRSKPRKGVNSTKAAEEGVNSKFCYQSETDLLLRSAVDLSDTWLNLGVTKDNLSDYGHKYADMVIQCTYNSKDCSDNTTVFLIEKSSVTSPIFGFCHTISVKNRATRKPATIKKGGTTQGIRLTLNIERSEYWDLISSEYGVRLLVHPQGTYPTLQRGGIIASPGRSVHIGVKRKVTKLLPGRGRSCTQTFLNSRIAQRLRDLDLDFDLIHIKYTYEHCNTLCQNTLLFDKCECLDAQPRIMPGKTNKWKFCNPCNKTEVACRSEVLRSFTDVGNICDEICSPSCNSVRYDISLSKADWPNLNHQPFVMNRSFEQWSHIPEAMGLMQGFSPMEDAEDLNATDFVNDTFFRENLLRVHLFVEEMIYMSIEESYSYTLPKLLADLGGCLGLYLGVSVISIIEFVDLCGSWSLLCLLGGGVTQGRSTPPGSRKNRRRNRQTDSGTLGYYGRKKGRKEEVWRNTVFTPREPPYYSDDIPRKDVIRRF